MPHWVGKRRSRFNAHLARNAQWVVERHLRTCFDAVRDAFRSDGLALIDLHVTGDYERFELVLCEARYERGIEIVTVGIEPWHDTAVICMRQEFKEPRVHRALTVVIQAHRRLRKHAKDIKAPVKRGH